MQLRSTIEGTPGKPVLVLANSLAATSSMWNAQCAAWGKRWQIVRFDYAGHGASKVAADAALPMTMEAIASDVLAMLDSQGVDGFSLIGLSLGGMLGMQLAAAAPQRLRQLVVANCRFHHTAPLQQQWSDRIDAVRAGGMDAILTPTLERWLTEAWRLQHPQQTAAVAAMIRSTSREGYAAAAAAVRDFDARPWLDRIRCPVLVVSGAQDTAAPSDHLDLLAALLKAQHQVLDPCAHLSSVERADSFNRGVADFLA